MQQPKRRVRKNIVIVRLESIGWSILYLDEYLWSWEVGCIPIILDIG